MKNTKIHVEKQAVAMRLEQLENENELLMQKLADSERAKKLVEFQLESSIDQLILLQNRYARIIQSSLNLEKDLEKLRVKHAISLNNNEEINRSIARYLFKPFFWLEKLLTKRNKISEDIYIIKFSNLFDKSWYLNAYPDVGESKVDPAYHYLKFGWKEGRQPSPLFNGDSYLEQNKDVQLQGINPLLHYLKFGIEEGRKITPTK
ncbi:hypothetical protein D1814_10130 [Alteromonas sp. BL110]|uniref:hypothetical protein n=1 Tax=Alteromonas sp. BL110 TaxID=1714845 RepID=UPI000E4F92E6|nr:hypothetical protein [Alteromonas sp. BL110]AXT39015.1 hypothetical protein D1814_10130 [Alteromonas sp. BL110]RKM84348.1 hypothetical protein D7031_01430 [Alteromonas sp. BL110]